jgi:hypothetical protein
MVSARSGARRTGGGADVVTVKVTLRGMKPPVWRRLQAPGAMRLGELHLAIQAAMGWDNCHLHLFDIGGRHYGDPHDVDDVADENRLTLGGLAKSGATRFSYTYDFGDDWEHLVVIEKTEPAVDGPLRPRCVAGKGDCPPEDCGGIWGYRHRLAVLADPAHPEYAEQKEWIGESFAPAKFDLAVADARLAAGLGQG